VLQKFRYSKLITKISTQSSVGSKMKCWSIYWKLTRESWNLELNKAKFKAKMLWNPVLY